MIYFLSVKFISNLNFYYKKCAFILHMLQHLYIEKYRIYKYRIYSPNIKYNFKHKSEQ